VVARAILLLPDAVAWVDAGFTAGRTAPFNARGMQSKRARCGGRGLPVLHAPRISNRLRIRAVGASKLADRKRA
jgi:hypothetical protein